MPAGLLDAASAPWMDLSLEKQDAVAERCAAFVLGAVHNAGVPLEPRVPRNLLSAARRLLE